MITGLTDTEDGTRIIASVNKLDLLQENQETNRDTFSKEFIVRNRRGLGVIPWQQLRQYRSYLKGFYFHARGDFKEAMRWYTDSLYVAEKESINSWRLYALENIEQIASKKTEDERLERKNVEYLSDQTRIGGYTWSVLKKSHGVMADPELFF